MVCRADRLILRSTAIALDPFLDGLGGFLRVTANGVHDDFRRPSRRRPGLYRSKCCPRAALAARVRS